MPSKKKADEPAAKSSVIRLPKQLVIAPEPPPVVGAEYTEINCNSPLDEEAALDMDRITRVAIIELADEVDDIDRQIEDLKQRKSEAEAQLATMLDESEIRSLSWGDYTLSWIHSSNSSLSRELLMANGIPSWLLKQCVTNKRFRYFKFTNTTRAAEKRAAKKAAGQEEEGYASGAGE